MKKLITILLSAFMIISVFTACEYRDPNAQRGEGNQQVLDGVILNPESSFSGTLKIAAPDRASHKSALNAFIRSFNEKYPNIKAEVTYLQLNDYKASIGRVAAASVNNPSNMYDVFWMDQDYINGWVDLDILSPLDSLMAADDNIDESDLNAQMLNICSSNNHLYLMPRDYNQVVMYYNKAIFDAARVPYPTDEMSGEAFKAMCEQLATNISKLTDDRYVNDYGVKYVDCVSSIVDCNVAWSSLDYPLVKSFGGEVVDENGEVVFDSAETAEAIRYWSDLVNTKVNNRISLAIDVKSGADNNGVQFRMQQSPVYLHARAVMSELLNEETMGGQTYLGIGAGKLGVVSLPKFGDEYYFGAGCSGYAMYKNCANATAAWQFLKHVVSIEGQNAYSETGDCVPVRTDLLNDLNASWRNCLTEKLGADFNHDAFIYKMDTAACSVYDFYPYVPFAAQTYVTARIEEAFKTCIQSTSDAGFASGLTAAANSMKNDIKTA